MDHVYGSSFNPPPVDTNEEMPIMEVPISAPLTINESMEVSDDEPIPLKFRVRPICNFLKRIPINDESVKMKEFTVYHLLFM